jgi:hypothetical protein
MALLPFIAGGIPGAGRLTIQTIPGLLLAAARKLAIALSYTLAAAKVLVIVLVRH